MAEEVDPIKLYPPKTYPSNKPKNLDCCFLDRDLFRTRTPTPTPTPTPTKSPTPTPSSTLPPTPTPSSTGLSPTRTPTPTSTSIGDKPTSCLGELPDGARAPAPPGKEELLYIIDVPMRTDPSERIDISFAPVLAFYQLNAPLREKVLFTHNKYVFITVLTRQAPVKHISAEDL